MGRGGDGGRRNDGRRSGGTEFWRREHEGIVKLRGKSFGKRVERSLFFHFLFLTLILPLLSSSCSITSVSRSAPALYYAFLLPTSFSLPPDPPLFLPPSSLSKAPSPPLTSTPFSRSSLPPTSTRASNSASASSGRRTFRRGTSRSTRSLRRGRGSRGGRRRARVDRPGRRLEKRMVSGGSDDLED